MKVLIVATGYPKWEDDFNNVYLHRLAKSLVRVGAEIHVVAPHAKGLKREDVLGSIFIHRFQYMYPANFQTLAYFPGIPEKIKTLYGKLQVPFFLLSMVIKMLQVIRKCDIDIINAHWAIPPGFLTVMTKVLHKRPVLITLYGAELFPINQERYRCLAPLIRYTINKTDTVVGISDATCESGKEISGRQDIDILPDGIDTNHFTPFVDGSEIRKRYGVTRHMIFSSGRMVERKGFRYLIEAMPFILKDYPSTRLVIGGDGPERGRLEKLMHEVGIRNQVVLPGFIPDNELPNHMVASDVVVLPSIVDSKGDTEGSATLLLEAMACGTPVVGTRVGGIPYAIKDGEGGYLAEQRDTKQLAEKTIMLLKNENVRKEIGERGRKYVEHNFSLNKIAQRYIIEFNLLLKGSNE